MPAYSSTQVASHTASVQSRRSVAQLTASSLSSWKSLLRPSKSKLASSSHSHSSASRSNSTHNGLSEHPPPLTPNSEHSFDSSTQTQSSDSLPGNPATAPQPMTTTGHGSQGHCRRGGLGNLQLDTHFENPLPLAPSSSTTLTTPSIQSDGHALSKSLRTSGRPQQRPQRAQTADDSARRPPGTAPATGPMPMMPMSASTVTANAKTSPLSAKGMGQSAIRAIRRVASAPNTKNLARRKSSGRKNDAKLTAEPVPVLPTQSTADLHPNTSLDTLSSGSSGAGRHVPRYRYQRPTTAGSSSGRLGSGLSTPGHTPFRRTYSSNSIKVQAVGSVI
jgi:protein-serine/threonine kinase